MQKHTSSAVVDYKAKKQSQLAKLGHPWATDFIGWATSINVDYKRTSGYLHTWRLTLQASHWAEMSKERREILVVNLKDSMEKKFRRASYAVMFIKTCEISQL